MVIVENVCHCFIVLPAHLLKFCILYIVILNQLIIPQFSSFVLIGDFNINFLDRTHPSFSSLCSILSIFGLTQVVDDQTHIHQGNCHSLIDLVLMSAPLSLPVRSFHHCQTLTTLESKYRLN